MIEKILLAVEDSPAALSAARVAIEIAAARRAELLAVHVLVDGEIGAAVGSGVRDASVLARRHKAAEGVLERVSRLASREGVRAETRQLDGAVAEHVLDQAREWGADLIVMGRSSERGPGAPYIGAQTRHVLEFADHPVLVVPSPRRPSQSWRE